MTLFKDFGLSNVILRAISAVGYETPTPIQRDAIPVILDGHDIMGLAQTGTGKTAAFGLPLIHRLLKDDQRPQPKTASILIVAPTRELVKQIGENLREYTRRTPLRVNMVVGGASIHFQKKKLIKGTDILVATPGRLMDLIDRSALTLDETRYLVLDEADQMLDLGFIHVLRKIAKMVGKPRQTLLFSATMPKQIEELAKAFLDDPVRIEVARSGKAADKVTQCVHFVGQGDKASLLRKCLSERPDDLSLVFSRTKHGAEKLMKRLVGWGFSAGSVHGNKSQGQRERAIKAFKSGETRILVATDVAARGIDIPGVSHVYNFDLPEVPENYVHRIGRTARAGREGEAIAFCAPSEVHLLGAIEKLMAIDVEVASGERPQATTGKKKPARRRGGNRARNGEGPSRERGEAGNFRKRRPRKREARGEGIQSSENFKYNRSDEIFSEEGKPQNTRRKRRGPQRQGKQLGEYEQCSAGKFESEFGVESSHKVKSRDGSGNGRQERSEQKPIQHNSKPNADSAKDKGKSDYKKSKHAGFKNRPRGGKKRNKKKSIAA